MNLNRGLAGLLLVLGVPAARAGDASGLDLTIEVLGRNDNIDERIVNRISIPGVELEHLPAEPPPLAPLGSAVNGVLDGLGNVAEGTVGSVVPLLPLLRYDEWVVQRKEAEQDRRQEGRDRARERRE